MKHIKPFESVKFINQEHRDLHNFAKRLEYAINKYFNDNTKKYNFGYTNFDYINVYYTYNHSAPGYTVYREFPIDFCLNVGEDEQKLKIFIKEAERLKIKHNNTNTCYELTIKQADELLWTIKTGFIGDDVEKYNL